MPCYKPLLAYWCLDDGKKVVYISKMNELPSGVILDRIQLPCGKCIGCRMEQARQWAVRCMHEAELHDANSMVTLTYDDDNCPSELQPVDVTKWLKRLRKQYDFGIRYFLCGEYGEKFSRPHYHCLLFGIDFTSKNCYINRNVRSLEELEKTWTKGFVYVSPMDFGTVAYVARYCLKKQEERNYVDEATGVVRQSEFTRMSRRPGIGSAWIEANARDTYKDDKVIQNCRAQRPPRYYDNCFKKRDEEALKRIKEERIKKMKRWQERNPVNLDVQEKIARAKNLIKKRSYERV